MTTTNEKRWTVRSDPYEWGAFHIVELHDRDEAPTEKEEEEARKLIAAAPALLEALREAARLEREANAIGEAYPDGSKIAPHHWEAYSARAEKCRRLRDAAIALAEGGE